MADEPVTPKVKRERQIEERLKRITDGLPEAELMRRVMRPVVEQHQDILDQYGEGDDGFDEEES